MASSDHLTPSLVDPWILRPTSFLDPWFADAFSRDTDALTRALQMSLSSPSNTSSSDTSLASSFLIPTPGLNTDGFASGSFEIENVPPGVEMASYAEAPSPKQRQSKGGVASGKVVKKRKSRASKWSQTTFITTDPASFRRMVQQVTGSRLGHNPSINIPQIPLPEPHRPRDRLAVINNNGSSSRLTAAAECLPTLDTSAFLLDQQKAAAGQGSVDRVATTLQPVALPNDFEQFGSFPTLESWNSM